MASVESVHNLLLVATRALDGAASEIRDAGLDPVGQNIEHVGHALAEISGILRTIYRIRPNLEPRHLREQQPHPNADAELTQHMIAAMDFEQAGNFEDAIAKYNEFLARELTPLHRQIAEGEIERIRRLSR